MEPMPSDVEHLAGRRILLPIEQHTDNLIEGTSGREYNDHTEEPSECTHPNIILCIGRRKQTETNRGIVANQSLGTAQIGNSGEFEAAGQTE
jgi:hypothetical protein